MWPSIASFWIFLVVGSRACSPQKDVVRLTCPDDIDLVAGKNSASAEVFWDANDFQVVSSHQIKGLYQIVPVHGASATFRHSFTEGRHFVEYKAVDSSGNNGQCSFTVTVRVARCSSMPPPQFGVIDCDGPGVYGTQCSVSCVPGYVPVGRNPECRQDGSWTYDPAYCRMTTCSDPGTPLFGSRQCSTSTHAYGSVCEFDCSHGYQLLGNRRIVCQSVSNRTLWSDPAPICQEIIPPSPESCPTSVVTHVVATSGARETEVPLPRILFRTASGAEAPFVCSPYGPHSRSRNFTVGLHSVQCTATDPLLGIRAMATCSFLVRVKANPCRPLAQPINGSLLCSGSHGGGSESAQRTVCRLFCNRGHVLPRPYSSSSSPSSSAPSSSSSVFECDRTGSWSPSSFVPGCVVPSRPLELRLPAEIIYRSSDCSSGVHQEEVRSIFQGVLQVLMRAHSACRLNPRECIVEGVTTDCQMTSQSSTSSRRRRRRNSNRRRHEFISATFARRRSVRRHLANADDDDNFLLSIKFHFATRLPSTGGEWPDEYHRASARLYAIFDYFRQQLEDRSFDAPPQPRSPIRVDEASASVRDAPMHTACEIGYDFNRDFLLCVPCGAGTYFNSSQDRCNRCPEGMRQTKQGQFHCN